MALGARGGPAMAVEQETTLRFTCDLCGRSQVTTPAPAEPLICSAAAQARISANLGERRIHVEMGLCDRCYGLLAHFVSELRKRFNSSGR